MNFINSNYFKTPDTTVSLKRHDVSKYFNEEKTVLSSFFLTHDRRPRMLKKNLYMIIKIFTRFEFCCCDFKPSNCRCFSVRYQSRTENSE